MNSVDFGGRAVTPSKVLCVGRNYVRHIEELGNEIPDQMVVFAKPNSAIGDRLCATREGETLHYEGEIALLVEGGRFTAAAFGLDLTRRGLQGELKSKGLPWERAKAFDGAALFSAFAPLEGPVTDLSLRLTVDGEERQAGSVGLMMYKPAFILEELSRIFSLEDGDIIMTGTPAGVGPIEPGATFEGTVFAGDAPLASGRWTAEP
jgi:2-keto-4-pentenoate hydratase/2-oxohepta-3-ene-1,7-dioic acid hydratase in catechol pathway